MEKNLKKNLNLFAVHLKLIQHCKLTIPQQKENNHSILLRLMDKMAAGTPV